MPPLPLPYEPEHQPVANRNLILFDLGKSQQLTIYNGYKNMARRLKNNWRIDGMKSPVTDDSLNEARVFVVSGPRNKFTQNEFDNLRHFIGNGGSLLVMMGEGGETRTDTNINFLLEEFGIMVNGDSVIRTNFFKYFHPKEALISNGVVNRAIATYAGKQLADDDDAKAQSLSYVFPFGATLNVNKLAVPILSTGSVCFPLNRPVVAFHHNKTNGGKVVVLGSMHIFHDQYIDKEDNGKIMDVIFRFLTDPTFKLNQIDAEDPELSDYHQSPDTIQLAEQIKVCLQEGEGEMPTRDFSKLFDSSLYSLDLTFLPKCIKAYDQLVVKHETLNLITPQFETPMPMLKPAVFPPVFRSMPPPELEMYDLDEVLSSEKVRLAQITNKCAESDLQYFVREAGDIIGITSKLPVESRSPQHILEFVFNHIVEFKKLNQMEGDFDMGPNDREIIDDDDYDEYEN